MVNTTFNRRVEVPVKVYNYVTCKEDGGCANTSSHSPIALTGNTFGSLDTCKEKCKITGYRCDGNRGCIAYWSSLAADQIPKDVIVTSDACKSSCKKFYKCTCEGKCVETYTSSTIPNPALFQTQDECQKNKACTDLPCKPPFFSDINNIMMTIICILGALLGISGIISLIYNINK